MARRVRRILCACSNGLSHASINIEQVLAPKVRPGTRRPSLIDQALMTATTRMIVDRFEAEIVPRILQRLTDLFSPALLIEMAPADGRGQPTRVRLSSAEVTPLGRFPYPLNLHLTWDLEEIEYLFEPGGQDKLAAYLDALPHKLSAWQAAREIDFRGHSQGQAEVLIGGLDFIG